MTTNLYGELLRRFQEQQRNLDIQSKKAREWFRRNAALVRAVSGNKILSSDRQRLLPQPRIAGRHIGRMMMFFYDPKLKKKLPFYDTYPLVIPIAVYPDGFLGLNLHYLPINLRARLLDSLYTVYKQEHLDENRKLKISYDILNASSKHRWFKPCIKRYLSTHLRSKPYIVDPAEWDMMLTLPTERFQKQTKEYVWADSKRKLGLK